MKPPINDRIHRQTLDSDVELVDTVRSRLVQGHDRALLPRQLHLLFGVSEADVVRALAVVDAEERASWHGTLGEFGRAGGIAVVAGAVIAAVVGVFGARAISALGFGVAAAALIVVVVVLQRRRRQD